jgi:hypothetical protein
MNGIKYRGKELKNMSMKEELIKRSLDVFTRSLSEEERKNLLKLDRKDMEKYLYRALAEGYRQKK